MLTQVGWEWKGGSMATERSVTHDNAAGTSVPLQPGDLGATLAALLGQLALSAHAQPEGSDDALLRMLAARLPVVVYAFDAAGRCTACYGQGLQMVGSSDDALVGARIRLFGPTVEAHYWSVLDTRETVTFEAEGETFGNPWVVMTVMAPSRDGSGVIAVAVDNTDRARADRAEARSERLFTAAVEALDEGVIVQAKGGRVVRANSSASTILGLTNGNFRELARPGSGWKAIHPDGRNFEASEFPGSRTSSTGVPQKAIVMGIVAPAGSVTWLSINAFPCVLDDEELVVSTFADITEARAMTEALRESEERTRAILETAADGIVTTDERGLIVEFNAAAERILGYDSTDVIGHTRLDELIAPEARPALLDMYAGYRDGRASRDAGQPTTEAEFVHHDGSTVPTELAITETHTSDGHLFTAVLHDISERRALLRELEHQATHDALTGLPNRALLAAELEAALTRNARRQRGVGVLFVELGRMKLVTDSLGHRAGDHIVVAATGRLDAVAGEVATVTRWGGDHLVLFAEDLDDVGDLVELATRVIETLEVPYAISGEEAFIKAWVGVAFAPDGSGSAESLISNADVAMHRARSAGTSYEVFDSEMRQWVDARRTLEIAMRHGIERDEFELYYQPVVTVSNGVIHGFEALVRWNHPKLGLLQPADFIPLAEDSGLIVPLGEQLLRRACAQLAIWQDRTPDRELSVSVNLSGLQLALPDLATTVASALLESSADPRGLDLEITETVLLSDVDAAAGTLDGLKKLGVNLVMDDFGTGYSSLSYLCRFPIDVVKVDRSFVSQIGTQSRDASMVSVVVGMAQTLRIDVVAEGVETDEQLDALRDLDCLYAQGYLFSKPCPASEAEALLTAR